MGTMNDLFNLLSFVPVAILYFAAVATFVGCVLQFLEMIMSSALT